MTTIELTSKDAQQVLLSLAASRKDPADGAACLTVNGRAALAVMPWAVYEEVARFLARRG